MFEGKEQIRKYSEEDLKPSIDFDQNISQGQNERFK